MWNLRSNPDRSVLRRLTVVGVAAVLVVACSSDDVGSDTLTGLVESADTGAGSPDPQVLASLEADRAALEQQVAELQAEVDVLRAELADARSDLQAPTPDPPTVTDPDDHQDAAEATSTAPETPAPAVDVEPSTAAVMLVRGDLEVPAGDGSGLEVVMIGTPTSSSLPVVVRNNTADPAYRIDVTATARNAEGTLVASGSSHGFTPTLLQPGEWAFGYVYLGAEIALDQVDLDFSLSSRGIAPDRSFPSLDIEVVEAELFTDGRRDRIVGSVRNPHDVELRWPVSVDYACFDDDRLVGVGGSSLDGDDLAAGATGSFTINLYGNTGACSAWAVTSSGYGR